MIITNDTEYEYTRERAAGLARALEEFEERHAGLDPLRLKLQRNAHTSLIGDLRNQMKEYEELKAGRVKEIRSGSLGELPQALVKARIARGLSVEQLAGMLGWKASQLRRYEERKYEKAPYSLLVEAATVLCVRVESRVVLEKMEKIPTAEELLSEVTRITEAGD